MIVLRARQYMEHNVLPRLHGVTDREAQLWRMLEAAILAQLLIPELEALNWNKAVYWNRLQENPTDREAMQLLALTRQEAKVLTVFFLGYIRNATLQHENGPITYHPRSVNDVDGIIAVLTAELHLSLELLTLAS